MGVSARTALQFDLPAGTPIGKYEVARKLAMGGMAEIYLARVRGSAGFEKLVVIKRILPTVADDPKFVQMFLDEARLAATLQHPNIADVYEVGEHDGAPFFSMEYIHGQDVRAIRHVARERKEIVPLAVSLAIVHAVASALDYAHERRGADGALLDLVHRDVSSSNVLVSYEGAIKLIDFGIARATSSTHKTQTGTLKGKIPYMSPEQCRGWPVDRRSDMFSLGVVMYELTTGRRPFRGTTDFAIMDQIVYQGATAPSQEIRNYPPELEAIVMRLLATKPDDRYQTAEAMLHDLDPFLAQHRLWVSPKQISRHMRSAFADKVNAWDAAASSGVSLVDHLSIVTSQSARSAPSGALVTPPSSFPAVMPASQQMDVPDLLELQTVAMGAPLADQLEPEAPKPAPMPELRSGKGKWIVALVALALVGGGGAFAYVTLDGGDARPAASAAKTTPPADKPAEPVPAPAHEAPLPTPVEAKKETPSPPPAETQPPAAPAEPAPVATKPAPAPKPAPVVVKKPVVTPPVHVAAKPAKAEPKPDPKPDTKKDEPKKDASWNIDSPFMPPSH